MQIKCPKCGSHHIEAHDVGEQAAKTLGSVVGATGGVMASLRGAEYGMEMAGFMGPAGMTLGGIIGALIGGLAGSMTGHAIGSEIGKRIDDNILGPYRCVECGCFFDHDDMRLLQVSEEVGHGASA